MSSEKQQPQPQIINNVLQPAPTPGMTINPRNVLSLPIDYQGKRNWSFGFLGCLGDVNTCCCALWCPCFVYGRMQRRLEYLNQYNAPAPTREEYNMDAHTSLYAFVEVCCGVGRLLQIGSRQAIRQRYNISGGTLSDVCLPICCPTCDLVQGHREVQLEEQQLIARGSAQPGLTASAGPVYVVQAGTTYPQPVSVPAYVAQPSPGPAYVAQPSPGPTYV